tara:strand:- start:397 stop:1311 length:915 start_codon:yes stop_codon:yes gene_type:complete
MRIAITGATGLVGRRLCQSLAAQGHSLRALTRDPQRARGLPTTDLRRWSPLEAPDEGLLSDVEAVVHLAGESVQGRWTSSKKRSIRESRVRGTASVVDAIKSARAAGKGPSVLVSASAIGWYGERGDEELGERDPAGSDFLAEVCQAWEAEAAKAVLHGVRVARLRFGLVLAPEGGALAEMKLPFSLGLGGSLGPGTQWWSWVHIEDLIALVTRALEDSAYSGPINVTAPAPVRQKEFAKALGGALNRPAFLPAPSFALKLALGEFSTELLTSKRVLPRAAQAAGYEFRFPDLGPALADLLKTS